ncbi:site-2 protease family protein [Allokutzneria albata]|uniref:Zn-dependent protease (Includes SpoIVFB) n=1 Tax=Allokutzneria albata TaxID=211114 RepID=A0A1G9SKJ8_ALLAB|nr:site-2 protease family protein [Allokutzneria albata]SDM35949.1 Zn-dependent protease (includes SpoIVFB) [Allokutzneria albata]
MRLHWSVLALAPGVTLPMALIALPRQAPGHAPAGYWIAGSAIAVLLVVSVAAHELAHVLAARSRRRTVKWVSLTLFGGSTELADEKRTPRSEAAISAAGPVMNLVLAGLFLALAGVGAAVGVHRLVPVALAWLGTFNVILTLVNLIPGVSSDGGQVVIAALWKRGGDLDRARTVVRRAGLLLGGCAFVLGAVLVLGGSVHSGLVVATSGWLLADPTGVCR